MRRLDVESLRDQTLQVGVNLGIVISEGFYPLVSGVELMGSQDIFVLLKSLAALFDIIKTVEHDDDETLVFLVVFYVVLKDLIWASPKGESLKKILFTPQKYDDGCSEFGDDYYYFVDKVFEGGYDFMLNGSEFDFRQVILDGVLKEIVVVYKGRIYQTVSARRNLMS